MIWDKQDVDFWQNAKVVAAGLDAGVIFTQVRAINAKQRRDGTLKPRESDPRYLAALLSGVGFTVKRAESALDRCVAENLLAREGDGSLRIVGWSDEWAPGSTSTERMRRHRDKQRRNGRDGDGVTGGDGGCDAEAVTSDASGR